MDIQFVVHCSQLRYKYWTRFGRKARARPSEKKKLWPSVVVFNIGAFMWTKRRTSLKKQTDRHYTCVSCDLLWRARIVWKSFLFRVYPHNQFICDSLCLCCVPYAANIIPHIPLSILLNNHLPPSTFSFALSASRRHCRFSVAYRFLAQFLLHKQIYCVFAVRKAAPFHNIELFCPLRVCHFGANVYLSHVAYKIIMK